MEWIEDLSSERNFNGETLKNLLDTLVNIEQVYISRWNFEHKKTKGIIEENWENEFWKLYKIYLPKVMNNDDYVFIIKEINKHTFLDKLPEYSSTEELKIVLLSKIDFLIERFNFSFWEEKNKQKIKITEYLLYYLKLFPEQKTVIEKNQKYSIFLSKGNYFDENNMCNIETKWKLTELATNLYIPEKPINILEEYSDNLIYKNLDEQVLKEFWDHFDEAFFEKWIENLRQNMKTFTKKDYKEIKWKEWEIEIRVKEEDLDNEPRLLRDAIWIDKFKKELEELRKTWNSEKIDEKEIEASNVILKELYKFPYQLTKNRYWYQPNKLNKYKEIFCVWFSLLWHAFLSELGIKHNWIDISWHSAINIEIWWDIYYFDWTFKDKIIKFSYWKSIGIYKEIYLLNMDFNVKQFWYSGSIEKILLSQIYNNKWVFLDKIWKIEEAIKMYNKSIELNPYFSDSYNNLWFSLKNIWKYEDAIDVYNNAIILNPIDVNIYINKLLCLRRKFKYKLSKLYEFTVNSMKWKDETFYFPYREEKAKIREFINKEDYDWLRKYLLSLEN